MTKYKYFEKNITLLKIKNLQLAEKLELIDESSELNNSIKVLPTKNNLYTLQLSINGTFYYLHSIYDPEKESNNLIQKLITDYYDIIFCGGFGLGYYIMTLFNNYKKYFGKLIIIEKNLYILKIALSLFDFSNIFKSDKFEILFENNDEIIGLNNILINSITKKVYTFIPQIYYQIDYAFYSNIKNLVESYLSRKNINIATLTRFQNLWSYNIIKNHKKFLYSKGINSFYNKYTNLPSLVISAGPSLNSTIELIKRNQNYFIIIAVDSIFQTLIKNNICPDFVVTVDPQFINYKYFEYNNYFRSILVAEISTFPLIIKNYKGPITFFSPIFPFAKWLESYTSEKGEIDMGGSVSTTAFDFAFKLGTNPIILIGQDLAFIQDRTHTKGSYIEKYWTLRYNRFTTSLNGIYKYIHNNLFLKIKSNNNQLVNTDKRMMIFFVWFENKMRNIQNEVKVYNTSINGAKINNMSVDPLSKILKENNFNDISKTKNELKNFNANYNNVNFSSFLKEIKLISKNLTELEVITLDSIQTAELLYQLIKNKSKKSMHYLLKKLDENDDKLRELSKVTNFLSLLLQDKIYSILEEYENYHTEEEKLSEDLKIAKRSLFLYKEILGSIKIFKQIFQIIK